MPDYSLAIHDRLSLLPLFQGLSKRELTEIVGQTRFEFARHAAGETLATEGSPSESLMFLLSGTVTIVRHSDDHSCVIEEHLAAPTLFFSEHLFGLLRRHSCTYIAREQCETLSISKTETLRLLDTYDIFRTHLLNLLSTRVQRLSHRPLRTSPRSIQEKICRYLSDRCLYPAGPKDFQVKMQQVATDIGESRLNVSRTLHAMSEEQLLTISREHIHVVALEKLF